VLEEALFTLEVPRGYKLQALELEDRTAEEHLTRMLRFYADTAAGKFPKRLDDMLALMLHLGKAKAFGKVSGPFFWFKMVQTTFL
jgi:hypothetical protein